MSQDPVAVAASNNPELTTLTAALSGQLNPQVDLVDTLNNGQYTVFAAAPPVFGALITAVGYPLTFAVCGLSRWQRRRLYWSAPARGSEATKRHGVMTCDGSGRSSGGAWL
jgi:hypothetical protein